MFTRAFHSHSSRNVGSAVRTNSNRCRAHSARTHRAFTLMELLIVMAIITILCGIIAPQLGAFANGRKGADAARTIVAMAHYARAQSIGEGRIYRMSTDGPTNSVILSARRAGSFRK